MFFVRLLVALAALGAAAFLSYEAYWTLAAACAPVGTGTPSLQILGVTLSFSLGLTLMMALALTLALFAAYVLFLYKSDS